MLVAMSYSTCAGAKISAIESPEAFSDCGTIH